MVRNNRYSPRYSNPNAALGGLELSTAAGAGITAGVDTVYSSEVTKVGKIITTHIYIDIDGLESSTTLIDIIGVNDAVDCHLGQIALAECGQVFAGSMTCLEVPAGGVDDIDLYAAVESTGAENDLVSGLTTQIALVAAGGAWTLNESSAFTDLPDAVSDYLYLCCGDTGTAVEYTAGKFLIEILGYEA